LLAVIRDEYVENWSILMGYVWLQLKVQDRHLQLRLRVLLAPFYPYLHLPAARIPGQILGIMFTFVPSTMLHITLSRGMETTCDHQMRVLAIYGFVNPQKSGVE